MLHILVQFLCCNHRVATETNLLSQSLLIRMNKNISELDVEYNLRFVVTYPWWQACLVLSQPSEGRRGQRLQAEELLVEAGMKTFISSLFMIKIKSF